MGQQMATKQSHEWLGKRQQPLVKGQQGGFARKSIANQDGDKIDHVILAKASSGETHLLLDSFEDALMGEDPTTAIWVMFLLLRRLTRDGCTSDTKTLSLVLTLVLRLVEFDGNIGHVIPGVVDADE